jgi:hypothetical protein
MAPLGLQATQAKPGQGATQGKGVREPVPSIRE